MSSIINVYGDHNVHAGSGHGMDIASQRADDLDEECLSYLKNKVDTSPFSEKIYAADVGCGQCGQGLRMARLEIDVTCIDLYDQFDAAKNAAEKDWLKMRFIAADLATIEQHIPAKLHAIICQRTIHYLPFSEAVSAVKAMTSALLVGGKLYISASGLGSELGNGYVCADVDIEKRMGVLSQEMANKHNIKEKVCLYSENELGNLLKLAGLKVEKTHSSPFGNIKAVAVRVV